MFHNMNCNHKLMKVNSVIFQTPENYNQQLNSVSNGLFQNGVSSQRYQTWHLFPIDAFNTVKVLHSQISKVNTGHEMS